MRAHLMKNIFGYKNHSVSIVFKTLIMSYLLFSCVCNLYAKGEQSLNSLITINKNNTELLSIMGEIEEQSNYLFVYNKDVDVHRNVSVHVVDKPLNTVLVDLFNDSGVRYVIEGSYIVLSAAKKSDDVEESYQNDIYVSGHVVDAFGEPIPGVTVQVEGTTLGAITDLNGNYKLTVPSESSVIVFSFIGYQSIKATVGSQRIIDVTLKEDTQALDEVVVIGYGTARKSDLTGSLTQVSDDSFKDQKVTRVDQALQGRAAGVQVSNTVGAPGGEVRIRVRGANSILGDNSPLFVVDGIVGVDFTSINPNDIQSMEVLKDASSTAIYGSRGANGVILITTKSGSKDDKINVSYSGNFTVSKMIKDYDLLSAGQYAEVYNAHQKAFGLNDYFSGDDIQSYYSNGGFDYVDAVLRTAISHEHQLSVDGGNKKTQWRVSANYLDQQGIIKMSDYQRFNIRANINTMINDKLSFRLKLNTSTSKGRNNTGFSGANTVLNQALAWAPTTNPYDDDGEYLISDPTGSLKCNPLALLYDAETVSYKTFITTYAGANYKILPELSLDFQAAYDQVFDKNRSWVGKAAAGASGITSASTMPVDASTIQTTTQLSFNKTLGKHTINAVAAFETQAYNYKSVTASATNLTFPELKYDNLAQAETYRTASDYSMWSLMSYLARVNYSYDSRYLASVSVRRDGSSKFADGNKFSTFPAAALAWNIKNEYFMEDISLISALKLRASWGLTGSQAIEPYATKSAFGSTTYAFAMGNTTSGISISNPANSNLKWENTEQANFGVDLGLFNNRLVIEADYYIKTTRDILLNKSVPAYQGGGSIVSNIGSVRNSGFDLNITGRIIETKDFSLESTLNFSTLNNEVLDLGNDEVVYLSSNVTGIHDGAYDFIYKVGEPLGTLYGLKYLGPWQKNQAAEAAKYGCVPGDARYADLDNNGIYDSSDYQIIGHSMPKYSIGWNTNLKYKNLSVNMFFQGVFGLDKFNYNRCIYMMSSRDVRGATFAEVLDRYIPGVNEDAYLPAWSPTSTWYPVSSLWLEDGSYLRLKNISVSYDFNIKKIGDLTVSLNATNLFTLTKYKGIDPEASNVGAGASDLMQGADYGAYPNSKSVTLGVNIRF